MNKFKCMIQFRQWKITFLVFKDNMLLFQARLSFFRHHNLLYHTDRKCKLGQRQPGACVGSTNLFMLSEWFR